MNSKKLFETLTKAVKSQQYAIKNIKTEIQAEKENQIAPVYNKITSKIKDQTKLKNVQNQELKTKNWLTTLPLVSYNCTLDERMFWKSILTRKYLPMKQVPEK